MSKISIFELWILFAQILPVFLIWRINLDETHFSNKFATQGIYISCTYRFMAYFSFLGGWIQKLRNSPCLLLLAYLFGYKLFERLKFDIMHTKKWYVASLCLYFKKSTLNPTGSNITHFRKFKVSWPFWPFWISGILRKKCDFGPKKVARFGTVKKTCPHINDFTPFWDVFTPLIHTYKFSIWTIMTT